MTRLAGSSRLLLRAVGAVALIALPATTQSAPGMAPSADTLPRPAANPADVATPDAIIAALYDVISGEAGRARDWNRFRSLFAPHARLIPTVATQSGGAASRPMSVDDYATRVGPRLEQGGFFERELYRTSESFGNVMHVFSTYDSRRTPTDAPFARGINSIQLLKDGNRWWVVTVYWDAERQGNAIPAKYLPPAPRLAIPPTNPVGSVQQRVGATAIDIGYSRPGVKGRTVFGALVPFGQVWRTGADNATRISFSTDVRLNGVAVPAGNYELFTIPGRTEWTVIIHQNRSQWGSYAYDQANDVARITARPVATRDLVESFTISVDDLTPKSATLNIAWERTRVPVRIDVDVVGHMVPQIEAFMAGEGRKPYFLAAMFYYENDVDINKAAEWINAAVAEQPTHIGILHRQALILARKGDTTAALAAARKSLDGAASAAPELKAEYTRLNTALIDRLTRRR